MIFIRDKWRPAPRHYVVLAFVLLVVLGVLWANGVFTFNGEPPPAARLAASAPVSPASKVPPAPAIVASATASGAGASATVSAIVPAAVPASNPAPAKAEAKTEVKVVLSAEKSEKKKQRTRPDLGKKPVATAQPVQQQASASAPVKVWEHWGAAPYATSEVEACRKAPEAIDGFAGAPEAVKQHFKRSLGVTCEGGAQVWLTPNQRLDHMWSGPDSTHLAAHIMTNVVVAELPVVRAPDGRLYRKGAVAEAAKALSWTFVHEGRSYVLHLPFECFNWSISIGPAPKLPPAPVAAAPVPVPLQGVCPDVYTLKVNVWQHAALSLPGVEQTHAKEELGPRPRFLGAPHVSRTHGGQIRRAYAAGAVRRSDVVHEFRVSLIMTPESDGSSDPAITSEKVIGTIKVSTGLHELRFLRADLERWNAIRLVEVSGNVTSPPRSGVTSLHEVRFFNRLPGMKLGEWDNNPDADCIMNEHWID